MSASVYAIRGWVRWMVITAVAVGGLLVLGDCAPGPSGPEGGWRKSSPTVVR